MPEDKELPPATLQGEGWWIWESTDGECVTRVDRLGIRLWQFTISIREGSGYCYGQLVVEGPGEVAEAVNEAQRKVRIMEPPIHFGWAEGEKE